MTIGVLGGSFDPPHIGHYFVIQQILELKREIDKILLIPAYQHQWKPAFASVKDRVGMLKYFVREFRNRHSGDPSRSVIASEAKPSTVRYLAKQSHDGIAASASWRTRNDTEIDSGQVLRQRAQDSRAARMTEVEISDIEIKRKGISYTIDTIKELKVRTGGEVYWIVGSDIVYEFDRWEKKDELIKVARFLVFPRDPYHLPKKLPYGFECIQDKHLITTNISSTIVRQRVKMGKDIKYLVPEEVERYIIRHKLYV